MNDIPDVKHAADGSNAGETGAAKAEGEELEDDEEGDTEEDEDDDGLDIVVAAPQRSMDFR
jgi:ribosomal protein L12E/L44/L45/RPP1/RPP2